MLVQAAIAGRLQHGMGSARLTDLPAEWSRQYPAFLRNNRTQTRTDSLSVVVLLTEFPA